MPAETAHARISAGRPLLLTLPWPPSANRYWRHPTTGRLAGRHLLSAEGRSYRQQVAQLVAMRHVQPMTGRLEVDISAYPPDRRRRDLDNTLKAALDAMQHAGVYQDDAQIDRLLVERFEAGDGVLAVRVVERGA